MTRKLPPSASVANVVAGAKLHAPSAERNAPALTDLLTRIAPKTGAALEIASGTGQHIIGFARAVPQLDWTPSEISVDRLASINAYRSEANLPNLAAPIHLDACAPGWADETGAFDLILTVNILHLISAEAAKTLIKESASALAPGGTLMLYGPFLRENQTTSDGDARFHAELQATDPAIGYKDRDTVIGWGRDTGVLPADCIDMPANNLALIFKAP